MTSQGSSGSAASTATLAVIIGITVTGIMGNVLITPVVPDIVDDFGQPLSRAGLLLALTTAPGIVLAPVMGVLADRFGRREVVVPCLVVFGLSGGLSMWAPSYDTLLALRFVQGIGSAGLMNLAIVLIADNWSGVERARMIGRNAAALTTAIVVLPPVGGALGAIWDWRATFAPYWLALGTAVVMQCRLPRGKRGDQTLRAQLRAVAPLIRTKAVLGPVALGAVAFVLIFGVFLTAVPLYMDRAFDVGPGGRGLVLALPALTSTASALGLGRLRARHSVRTLLAAGFGVFTASFALLGAVESMVVLCLASLLYGVGDGLVIATLQDGISEAAPPEGRGAVVAVWVGVVRAGQTAGPVLASSGVDGPGVRPTFAAAAVVAALLAVTTPWTVEQDGQEGIVAAPPMT
jgi:ACDE family multidrug resistance protein